MFIQLIIGFLLGILISLVAWQSGSLSKSGAVAAAVSGGLIFGFGGFPWGILLLTFFITSSVLSKSFKYRKEGVYEKYSKGHRRDWGQVLANGGLGSLLAISFVVFNKQLWIWFAFTGAMAAVNADTWATELGILNPTYPRLITSWRIVEPGSSGGVSLVGILASLGGATLIGMFGGLFSSPDIAWYVFLSTILAGFFGSTFDSILGATLQAIYHCPQCEKETERHPQHTCGTTTQKDRGLEWLNNDVVNFLASLVGAFISVGIWTLLD